MPDETRQLTRKSGGWGAVKRHLKGWNAAELTALIQDLYGTSSENRAFIPFGLNTPELAPAWMVGKIRDGESVYPQAA